MILDGVMRQFRVVPHFHFLQEARAVHADGLDRQRQFARNIANRLAGRDHDQGLVFTVGQGFMQRRVAILDAQQVNAGVMVFVSIKTDKHSLSWLERFHSAVADFPEVVEFYRMSGDVDYLLRVVVPDIASYDAFYKRMIAKIEIRDVSSAFAMEQIKYSTALPVRASVVAESR